MTNRAWATAFGWVGDKFGVPRTSVSARRSATRVQHCPAGTAVLASRHSTVILVGGW